MKNKLAFFIVGIIILGMAGLSAAGTERSLRLCTWVEAFPSWVLSEFQEETGIKVYPAFFANEEMLYQRLSQFPDSYDLVECSPSYVFQQMVKQGLVKRIDKARFPYWGSLNHKVRTLNLDPDLDYLIPYVWGSLMIAINPEVAPLANIQGFADLWQPAIDGKLLIPDDLRSICSFTLLALGLSPNDLSGDNLPKVVDKLKLLVNHNTVITTNNMSDLVEGRVGVAVGWNGSILEAMQENPNIRIVKPKEGMILWLDGFFIPAQSKNQDEAYEFLRFIFRPDICARITKDTMYATTNLDAIKLLPQDIVSNPLVYLSEKALSRSIMEEPIPQLLELEDTFWPKLRAIAN